MPKIEMKMLDDRMTTIEKKVFRIENLLWYTSIAITLKFGSEALPMVTALIFGGK